MSKNEEPVKPPMKQLKEDQVKGKEVKKVSEKSYLKPQTNVEASNGPILSKYRKPAAEARAEKKLDKEEAEKKLKKEMMRN